MFIFRRHSLRRKEDLRTRKRPVDENFIPVLPAAHRFVSRDGTANILKQGILRRQPADWYHHLLTMSRPGVFFVLTLAYIIINSLFALLYMADPTGFQGHQLRSFFDYFFFSSHIFSTVGLGRSFPESTYINTLVTMESFIGWCSFGLITGLLFSRFSRPTARLIFSHYATIEAYDGKQALVFRTANRRGNMLLHGKIHVSLARNEKTVEGDPIRRVYELPLLRSQSTFFNLTWTVRHVIDEKSPLFNQTAEMLHENETEIEVLLSGTDDAFGQTVHGHFAYNHDEILFGHRFANMFRRNDEGHPVIDFSKFDTVEKIKAAPPTEEKLA
ncbi:MAG: ATP-sensitive inward rectifier potassium channel 10 [Alphaproteobacteria bacterium]|nr:ATP-sensitive inward rectifier potassium channel 10 [Alphaproteobacteria bacterium]